MKKAFTISIMTGYLLLMGALGVAAGIGNKNQVRAAVKQEIVHTIYVANYNSNRAAEIKATVKVDESGKVSVSEISSSSEILKQYVVYQLEKMTIQHVTGPETFKLLIRFVAA